MTSITGIAGNTSTSSDYWVINTDATYINSGVSIGVKKGKDETGEISPVLYFKYIKSKFKILERIVLEKRLKQLEKAFDQAVENGQNALAEKFLQTLARETRESAIFAKGIKYYIEEKDLTKYKHKIKGGHISDTVYEEYTRVIPKLVVKRYQEVKEVFDKLVIYHYWNSEAEDIKHMSKDEKEKMKDPVLFGTIKETDKLYFICDWVDEYCDLTFNKLISFLGKDKKQIIGKPSLVR